MPSSRRRGGAYPRPSNEPPDSDRLDRRLRAQHPVLSWTRARGAIERGQVSVDGVIVRDPTFRAGPTARIVFDPSRPALPAARLDLPRLYEDEHVLVIDKPAGLLTIPTSPDRRDIEDSVLARVQQYVRRLRGREGYAGILHRLDRDTSGALAIALSREAHARGRELFAAHRFERVYLALVHGVPEPRRGTIDAPISSAYAKGRRQLAAPGDEARPATTHYRVRDAYGAASLVEVRLDTGRQHQVRLHLQSLGHPLLGEKVYATEENARPRAPRPMLHAWRLAFPHPMRRGRVAVEAPMPADMTTLCGRLARQHAAGRSHRR